MQFNIKSNTWYNTYQIYTKSLSLLDNSDEHFSFSILYFKQTLMWDERDMKRLANLKSRLYCQHQNWDRDSDNCFIYLIRIPLSESVPSFTSQLGKQVRSDYYHLVVLSCGLPQHSILPLDYLIIERDKSLGFVFIFVWYGVWTIWLSSTRTRRIECLHTCDICLCFG